MRTYFLKGVIAAALAAAVFSNPAFATYQFQHRAQGLQPQAYIAQYLVVAGGGGGGVSGAGAGGVLQGSLTVTPGASYSITVGQGGVPVRSVTAMLDIDGNGGNSSFGSILSLGGGAGATSYTGHGGGAVAVAGTSYRGATGGSGGGSGGNSVGNGQSLAGGLGTPGQGFNGGSSTGGGGSPGGGGGGAGAAGVNAGAGPGAGGAGVLSTITGVTTYYGGGGGGGSYSLGGGAGGIGGGGAGASGGTTAANGVNGTGGGGGGQSGSAVSGRGGDGIVIVAVPLSRPSPTFTCTPTSQTVGAKRVYTFSSACTMTF